MRSFFSVVFASLMLLAPSHAKRELEIGIWHRIDPEPEKFSLFLAYQEAAFLRIQIGEWLPLEIFDIAAGVGGFWRVDKSTRKANLITVRLDVETGFEYQVSYDIDFHNNGEDTDWRYVVSSEPSVYRVAIRCGDGTQRDIIISSEPSLE